MIKCKIYIVYKYTWMLLKTKPRYRRGFQTEDKVFSLSQSERNDGGFGDLAARGVYEYVKRRERRKAMTAGVAGLSRVPRLFDFRRNYIIL